jgi:autotransporter translocation and assembly factor TamB
MTAFVVVVIASVLYLVWFGDAGKQRGLVVTNLRTDAVVLTLGDGQTASFEPNQSQTLFAVKSRFPMSMRVTSASGALIFDQQIQYASLVDSEFRIAISETGIVFQQRPQTG